jgi:hypothetical protein
VHGAAYPNAVAEKSGLPAGSKIESQILPTHFVWSVRDPVPLTVNQLREHLFEAFLARLGFLTHRAAKVYGKALKKERCSSVFFTPASC